jgi:hypothetical protein
LSGENLVYYLNQPQYLQLVLQGQWYMLCRLHRSKSKRITLYQFETGTPTGNDHPFHLVCMSFHEINIDTILNCLWSMGKNFISWELAKELSVKKHMECCWIMSIRFVEMSLLCLGEAGL